MDLNRATGFHPNAKAVFEMIRTHAVQGMFGDPAHGGNTTSRAGSSCASRARVSSISARDQRLNVVPKSDMQVDVLDATVQVDVEEEVAAMPEMLKPADVVVIGTGAAGGTAVWPLANAGLKVVALEAVRA